MYKITNKQTGFSQYMNKEDYERFSDMNGLLKKGRYFTDKYRINKIKEIDTEFIEQITYAILGGISLSVLMVLFYFVNI